MKLLQAFGLLITLYRSAFRDYVPKSFATHNFTIFLYDLSLVLDSLSGYAHKNSCPTCSCLPCFLIFSHIKGCFHWILAWTHVSVGLRRGRGCFVFGSGRRQSDKGAPLRGTRTATQYQQQVWTLLNSGPGFHLALLGYISFLDGRQMN